MSRVLCEEHQHIEDAYLEECPRCGSNNIYIEESLYVTDYCEGIHYIDIFNCLKCDAKISIDLYVLLKDYEKRLAGV